MKNSFYFITVNEFTPGLYSTIGGIKKTRSLVIDEHPAAYLMKNNGLNRTEVSMLFFEEVAEEVYQTYKNKELRIAPVLAS